VTLNQLDHNQALAQEIKDAIARFEDATGGRISSVAVERIKLGNEQTPYVTISVSLLEDAIIPSA